MTASKKTARIRLIHWKPGEAEPRVEQLRGPRRSVEFGEIGPEALKGIKADPPDVLVIDLSRLPSQGRDLGVVLRRNASTRDVPLVFAGGAPEKVNRVREVLGDAIYADWDGIDAAIELALRPRRAKAVVPESHFAAYAGTPLVKKLGIRQGATVALIGEPEGFREKLTGLPDGVTFRSDLRGRCDLAIWFVRTSGDLRRRVGRLSGSAPAGGVWVAWPKKASGVGSDLTQKIVREIGLASGLVDYKVCSIDDVWSGLKFTVRK